MDGVPRLEWELERTPVGAGTRLLASTISTPPKLDWTRAPTVYPPRPDGSTRDVTREAFVESGNTEVAEAQQQRIPALVDTPDRPVDDRRRPCFSAGR